MISETGQVLGRALAYSLSARMLSRLTLVTSLLQCVTSFQSFQTRIPNGDSVPDPCKPGTVWPGVGHFQVNGTGPRNQFGLDFAGAGLSWTVTLCRTDSDGDGRTNGVELGDPDCVWTEREIPRYSEGLTHPGICDPRESPTCQQKRQPGWVYSTQQQWLTEVCRSGGLDCPALEEEGVRHLTIRFPPGSRVPPRDTTYMCVIVDVFDMGLPRDGDFHMVAVTPAIDNQGVIHHIALAACTDDTRLQTEPYDCVVASPSCEQYLYVWTVGRKGECYNQQAGIRIGRNGYKTISLELHWNNPQLKAGLTDSSGLILHYTPNLRQYDAGILMVGPSLFFLPPHQPHVEVRGRCDGLCTRQQMLGPIIITSAWNHMHYAGTQMSVEVTRNKEHVAYLTDDRAYDFHAVRVYSTLPPLEFLPGDELLTRCVYNTSARNSTTMCDMGAQGEMCFSFISYYPKENLTLPQCLDKLGVNTCSPDIWGGCTSLDAFTRHINQTRVFQEVRNTCKLLFPCLTECLETILKFKRTEPCMTGHTWDYIQAMLGDLPHGIDFLSRLASCKAEEYAAPNSPTSSSPSPAGGDILLALLGFMIFGYQVTSA